MRGGFCAGTEQQKHHGHHLLSADASTFLLYADQFCNQTFAAGVASNLKAPLNTASSEQCLRSYAGS
jgi:hypothetical protein